MIWDWNGPQWTVIPPAALAYVVEVLPAGGHVFAGVTGHDPINKPHEELLDEPVGPGLPSDRGAGGGEGVGGGGAS